MSEAVIMLEIKQRAMDGCYQAERKIQSLEKQMAILKEAVEPCKNSLHIPVDDILKMREALKQIEEIKTNAN